MKKNNKKGFTLVELVIVIAVIAILSAILVPTFGNIIASANNTKAQADAKSAVTTHLAEVSGEGETLKDGWIVVVDGTKQYYMQYTAGNLGSVVAFTESATLKKFTAAGTDGWAKLYTNKATDAYNTRVFYHEGLGA